MRTYFAFTPYHLLLVATLQDRAHGSQACVVYADESGLLRARPEILKLFKNVSFEQLPPSDREFTLRDLWDQRANGRRARQLVRKYASSGDELFICNSTRPETQWLRGHAGAPYSLQYVEDGLDAYLPTNQSPVSTLRRMAHRTVYGRRHPFLSDMVSRLSFDSYHVLFPDLFRLDGQSARVLAINAGDFRKQVLAFGEVIGLRERYDDEPFTHLRALRHTERVRDVDAYVSDICDWAVEVRRAGGRPAVKAHPREYSQRLRSSLAQSGAEEFPSDLPAEVLTPLLTPDCVIECGLSTFVMTSRLMLPDRRVVLDGAVDDELSNRLTSWDPLITVSDKRRPRSA